MYQLALRLAKDRGGIDPAIHDAVGDDGRTLLCTDAETTKLVLVGFYEDPIRIRVFPFKSILDVAAGESAQVGASCFGLLGAVDGVPVAAGLGSINRMVTARWINLFVDDASEPRISIRMPGEAQHQKWYDLVRLGVGRQQLAERTHGAA